MEPIRLCSPEKHHAYMSDADYKRLHTESFAEYIQRLDIPLVKTYEVPSDSPSKLKHSSVPEVHRSHFRAVINFVLDVQKRGKSIKDFDESKLALRNGKLVFHGIEFVAMDKERDYKLLHDLIKNLINNYSSDSSNKCESLQDLHKMLQDSRLIRDLGEDYETLLKNHLAILPYEKSLELIKNFSKKGDSITNPADKKKYETVLDELQKSAENSSDWTKRFDGSDPTVGAAKSVFDYEFHGEDSGYVGVGTKGNRDLLRFCKNLAEHLPKYIPNCTKKDVELIIMSLFGTELLSMQELIFKYGLSMYFIPEQGDMSYSGGGRQQKLSNHPRYRITPDVKQETVHKYISGLDVPIINRYEGPAGSSWAKLCYYCLPQEVRTLFMDLVEFVRDIHKDGLSLKCLDESNLVIQEGTLKFKKLKTRKHLGLVERKKDFIFVSRIIKKWIGEYTPKTYKCSLVNHFLDLLENKDSYFESPGLWIEDLLPQHLAILPHDKSVAYITNFHGNLDYIENREDRNKYHAAVKKMLRSDRTDWTRNFKGSKLQLESVKRCFNFRFRGKKKEYVGSNPRHLLAFCGILARHLARHMRECYPTLAFTSKDVFMTIMALFGTQLLYFMQLIFVHGISKHFLIPE